MLTYLTVDGWNTMTAFDDLYASISLKRQLSIVIAGRVLLLLLWFCNNPHTDSAERRPFSGRATACSRTYSSSCLFRAIMLR